MSIKFYETHFEEYTQALTTCNLHPKLIKIFNKFPKDVHLLKNLIFYGASGTGKYSQVLSLIHRYSHSLLKYEKKLSIVFNKQTYYVKMSDIHFEVDMSLLGCQSKLLWHEIYQQIVDIITQKVDKVGIIVCKYFHHIHNELLENFYSYIQDNNILPIKIIFIIITEEIGFIQNNILNYTQLIPIHRPSKHMYRKCCNFKNESTKSLDNIEVNALNTFSNINISKITNIKSLKTPNISPNIHELTMHPYQMICDKIIHQMNHVESLSLVSFRDLLYDIFIYNLNITDCIWYIFSHIILYKKISNNQVSLILLKTYSFLKYYNNNYRPIYHLESYLLYLTSVINEFQ
jgi:hypothetical protein